MNSIPGRSGTADMAGRLAFFKGLQAVIGRIHAAGSLDEILSVLNTEARPLFAAERVSLYLINPGERTLSIRQRGARGVVKTGRMPIMDSNLPGLVAQQRCLVNLRDASDEAELRRLSPRLSAQSGVDEAVGGAIKQCLLAPLVSHAEGSLSGVLQIANQRSGRPFSQVEEEGMLALAQNLGTALERHLHAIDPPSSKYEGLVREGKITAHDLERAMQQARKREVPLERVLLEDFALTPADIGRALSQFFGVPYEPFKQDRIKPMDLLRHFKRDYAMQSQWLPLEEGSEGILIMAVDPEQVIISRVASNVFADSRLLFCVTTQTEFDRTVEQMFGAAMDDSSVSDLLSDMNEDEDAASTADDISAAADNELVKLVNRIIMDAYRQGASDIHIEPRPGKEKTLIRFRKDGSLVPYIEVPASYRSPLVTRIKIMCDLDISERRKPQDGKIKFRRFAPLDIELRVATLPTAGGMEDVVMRILGNSEPIPLDKLGLSEHNLTRLKQVIAKPYGLFFVCGPTGSGKTTTLHSILSYINTPDTKIWTAEDPVEITQKGLRQVQVNRKAGIDFATMMRAFLRADPDVIMVGEMRDHETVSVGIEASLTGHLVFSTLHTNSAPESVVRLLDMGMDPFNFADALLGVLAQRLAKRLCTECRQAYRPTEDEIRHLLDEYCEDLSHTPAFKADPAAARAAIVADWRRQFADLSGQFTLYRPVGCDQCTNGYKSRVGLHELMLGSDAVRELIQNRARVAQLLAVALAEGMRTLRQDGIEKVLAGITDLAQVRKVCIR